MILYEHFKINSKGNLEIGGCDSIELAEKYGTPLYVLDENQIRKNCRAYKNAINKYFGENGGEVAFASKALSFKGIYRIITEEGLFTDIVSSGELETVKAAGFPLEKAYYHGNNKTDFDIEMGLKNNIGVFVVDKVFAFVHVRIIDLDTAHLRMIVVNTDESAAEPKPNDRNFKFFLCHLILSSDLLFILLLLLIYHS
jgi:diaminopimelate decarboxylase